MTSGSRRSNDRQPWPMGAESIYRNIESLAGEIDRLLTRIWLDGLGGERNLYLIRDLLPIVRKMATEIQNECNRYDVLKRGNSWPHWPGWAVRDIEAVAAAIVQAANMGGEAFARQPPNLPRVRNMIDEALDYPALIRGKLFGGPPPESEVETVPAIWQSGLDDLDLEWE